MGHRRLALLAAVVVIVVVAGVFAVRFVVFPRANPIGKTDLVVVLSTDGDRHKVMIAKEVLAKNPGITMLYSADGGCPSYLSTLTRRVVCFRPDPDTTQGEARFASGYATSHHDATMTVVVLRAQLSRARIRFSRCWRGGLTMVESPSSALGALEQVPYQVLATVKAETFQRSC